MQSSPKSITRAVFYTSLSLLACWGCSGSSTGGDSGAGGSTSGGASTGGNPGAGGTSTGGSTSSVSTTGGQSNTGGAVSKGGSPATGGATNTGGSESTGGATAIGSGGATATGGKNATGGKSTTGGAANAGGAPTTGGAMATGGASAGGGQQATGGSKATGGASAVGGANAGGAQTGGAPTSTGGQASTTCPSPALASGDSNKTITVGGLSREYILHVPTAYKGTTAVPLVLDFHPIGGSASAWRSGSPYPAVIDSEGVVSVFPNGKPSPNMGNAWNVQGCCVSKINGADVDDVAFAKAIVAEVQKVACIDPKRVYAVGFSMGGGMSNYLACHAADTFAAVGPAAFDLTQQNVTGCTPSRPLTVIEWRGKNDNVVPYAGGHSALVTNMAIDFLGAVGTFEKWASLNQCTGSPSAADSNGCQTYSQCGSGVQVTLCTAASGGHEAAKATVVWPMLKKYSMP